MAPTNTDHPRPDPVTGEFKDLEHPWGRYFSKFTPPHRLYYFFNIGRQMLEALILNALSSSSLSGAQSGAMAVLELYAFYVVAKDAPYVLMKQSRVDIVTALGRCLTYGTAFLTTIRIISGEQASAQLVNIQM